MMVGYWAECRPSGPGQERATADVPGSQLECPVSTLLRGKADGRQAPQVRTFADLIADPRSGLSASDPKADIGRLANALCSCMLAHSRGQMGIGLGY